MNKGLDGIPAPINEDYTLKKNDILKESEVKRPKRNVLLHSCKGRRKVVEEQSFGRGICQHLIRRSTERSTQDLWRHAGSRDSSVRAAIPLLPILSGASLENGWRGFHVEAGRMH